MPNAIYIATASHKKQFGTLYLCGAHCTALKENGVKLSLFNLKKQSQQCNICRELVQARLKGE